MGSKPIISNVIKGELDVGFVLLPDDCSELSVRRIMSDEIVLVVPEGHELAKYKAISIRLLKDIPLIMLDSTYQIYDNVMRAFNRAGIEANIIALSKSWDYIVELVPPVARNNDTTETDLEENAGARCGSIYRAVFKMADRGHNEKRRVYSGACRKHDKLFSEDIQKMRNSQ